MVDNLILKENEKDQYYSFCSAFMQFLISSEITPDIAREGVKVVSEKGW